MTEYDDSAPEFVVRCGIAPIGWKLLRSSDRSGRFQITVYHIRDAGRILKNRHCQPRFGQQAFPCSSSNSYSTI